MFEHFATLDELYGGDRASMEALVTEQSCIHFLMDCFEIAGYVLFVTSTDHFGVSFGPVEKGDTIALLAGSKKPLVLRSDEKGSWRCIGSAYVSGIMKGEAWPSDTPVEELETFQLT
jgi:hypothetical protein